MPNSGLENALPTLENAVALARSGDSAAAHLLFKQIVAQEPGNALAWVWLAFVSSPAEEKRAALRKALSLAPEDRRISEALNRLTTPHHIALAAHTGVFINYARPDELFAVNLTESLRSAGVHVWLDVTDMPDDGDWKSAILSALDTCGVMLMILSPAALQSSDLRAERQQFMANGKIILPVVYQTCDLNKLEIPLSSVDFRHDYDLGLQQLLKLLL